MVIAHGMRGVHRGPIRVVAVKITH
jgi:hypothetical protein